MNDIKDCWEYSCDIAHQSPKDDDGKAKYSFGGMAFVCAFLQAHGATEEDMQKHMGTMWNTVTTYKAELNSLAFREKLNNINTTPTNG